LLGEKANGAGRVFEHPRFPGPMFSFWKYFSKKLAILTRNTAINSEKNTTALLLETKFSQVLPFSFFEFVCKDWNLQIF
jgi:hypothetical protein